MGCYADGREYTPTVIAVSDSKEDWNSENTEVIYNSDQENIYGFGAGTDEGYAETAEGREFSCDTPVTGQYVRIYSCGSNINQGNHLVEFEVYGTVHGQVPGKVSVTVNEGEHFSVIAEEGSESPMEPGADYSFKVQAKSGYYVSSVTVNESVLEPEDGIYTIRDVQEDQTVNVQVLPYPDAENLALKKPVEVRYTADGSEPYINPSRPKTMAVDGIIPEKSSDPNYCDFGNEKKELSAYLQVDLRGNYELSEINLWRYWNDGRIYNGTVVAVADTEEEFSEGAARIVYNSDTENYHGLGSGDEEKYTETKDGFHISLKDKFPDQIMKGRFVRIYMYGSNSGSMNHVVECQVMGYNLGEKPYKAQAFDNSGNYLDLPTHYNWPSYPEDPQANPDVHIEGQVTHPDVIQVKEGFGGHQYWMFYTPNVMVTSQFENPYIVYSDDGINWEEPVLNGNSVNPVVQRVSPVGQGEIAHNCDTDLVYDEKNDRILAYWNWAADQPAGGSGCEVRMIASYDGINWGAPVDGKREVEINKFVTVLRDEEIKYNYLSPTITYDSWKDLYFMYYNNTGNVGYFNGQDNKVQMKYSKDGINWSEETLTVQNFLGTTEAGEQLAPWHQDIQYIESKNEYWALSQCFTGNSPDNSVLYMTKSKDGLNWSQVGSQPVLTPNDAPFWNDFQIYRSTFLYNEETDSMDIWYSALQTTPEDKMVQDSNGEFNIKAGSGDSRIWRIGHTSNNMKEVMKALTQNEFYEEEETIPSRGFILKAEKTQLEPGETTKTSRLFSTTGGWGGGGTQAENNVVTDMNVKYVSDNEEVAAVDPWGNITAKSEGQAIITGLTKEGSETTILITVGEQQKAKTRHVISKEQPLYISNYYWSDGAPVERIDNCDAGQLPENNYITVDADGNRTDRDDPLKLWNAVPDDLKDNTVILLIAERSIKDNAIESGTEDVNAVRNWYKQQIEYCNAHQIPCAVQNLNGETSTYDRIPLTFWKELAEENEYLVGFNGAELYNCFSDGQAINNGDEYVADLIRMGASLGVSMMWTDTNVFGNHGVLMDWLEEEGSVLGAAMKDNSEYVSMMYKESYGDTDTEALYLGLWLAGYCDNWGVASDWWHWSIDGNGSMFDAPGSIGGWGQCLVWPENMYSQDVIRVASMGATCYKSEPQWYSVASNGHRTPAYQYSLMPTLKKVCSGEIAIPDKEMVMDRTKLIVKGT